MDQYIGKLLDNRHEILELIGSGGMARVYKARDHRLNRLVAIKILREDLAEDAEFRRRFHDESQAVAMLSHPNIVAVYDVSRSSQLEYIVMELIDGITLKQYMQRKGNKLNWREALHFTTQIVKALGHAHSRGIIHRDIKPHNIMVLRDGSVKVADFGIARVSSSGHSTLTQEALGSVHYISPEQARGSYIDARSDLYSAGVVLYEMITGRLPFEGDSPVAVAIQHINSIPLSPREIDPSIPEALEAITMKAMAPNPDDRYLTADDMLADLEEFRKNPNINFDYKPVDILRDEYDDEDATRRVPYPRSTEGSGRRSYPSDGQNRRRSGSGGDADRRRRSSRYYEEDEEEEEEPSRGAPWVLPVCVIAVLLFVVIVCVFLYRTFFASILAPTDFYPVPDLEGKLYEDVINDEELLEDGRFTVILGETVSDEAEEGTIIKQDPAPGSKVKEDETEITVTVSGGEEPIEMPDLYNKEERAAIIELQRLGISAANITTRTENSDITENYVISTTPRAGDPITEDTRVELVVSMGPESTTFPMPNLVNMTKENALKAIDNSNLMRGDVEEEYDESPKGTVIYQYPAATTPVEEGTRVTIHVSKGPDPSTQEDPPEEKPDPSQSEEKPTPPPVTVPKEVTKTITYILPDTGGVVNLQVMMDGKVIFQQNYDTAMSTAPASFEVTASGTKTLTYYVDGVLTDAIDVVFSQ